MKWVNLIGHKMAVSLFSATFSNLFLSLTSKICYSVHVLLMAIHADVPVTRFMEDNAHKAPFTKNSTKPEEKLAAYLMGRWKNGTYQSHLQLCKRTLVCWWNQLPGTPVDLNPHDDEDPKFHASNNFDYHPIHEHDRCPFAAHTRKMRPRGDLDNDHAVIIRRGISYGDEVTDEERRKKESNDEIDRGLLFVCYQSDIRNGFNFLTTRKHHLSHLDWKRTVNIHLLFLLGWASNHNFPDSKTEFVGEHGPGIDAIVGQKLPHHPPRSIGLPDGNIPTQARLALESWVVQRGGEYFFTPSIKALRDYLTGPPDFPPSLEPLAI